MKTLRARKYQIPLFIADEIELSSLRDEVASMEHPFFAMKAGDSKARKYKNGNVTITVESTDRGLATIFDKDIWIYAISKLQEAINNGQTISRTISFTPYDFFITTNRDNGGRNYVLLEQSLSRLSGTRIKTNIVHAENNKKTVDFGLIDKWELIEKRKGYLNISMVEITLPDWLYQAITKTKVLKISPDYFRIRKAIDRRIYEIARKHCGNQNEFIISLEKLHLKTGSTAKLAKFKFNIKQLSKLNDLPDYKIFYDLKTNNVIFTNNKELNKDKVSYSFKKSQEKYNFQKKEDKKKKKKLKKYNKVNSIKQTCKKNLEIPKGFR